MVEKKKKSDVPPTGPGKVSSLISQTLKHYQAEAKRSRQSGDNDYASTCDWWVKSFADFQRLLSEEVLSMIVSDAQWEIVSSRIIFTNGDCKDDHPLYLEAEGFLHRLYIVKKLQEHENLLRSMFRTSLKKR